MKHLVSSSQALKSHKRDRLMVKNWSGIPEGNIRTVEISFYDHEVYAGDKLIANIGHDDDDFVTQCWVVKINGVEIHRAHTWAKCYHYITWHFKQGTRAIRWLVNHGNQPVHN
jgi:hypothetical protein